MGKFARQNQKQLRREATRSQKKPKKASTGIPVTEREDNDVDVNDDSYMYGDADQHARKKHKELMGRGIDLVEDANESDQEEILPVDGSSDEEDDEDDDDDVNEDDGLPSRDAWGNKRSNYYNTDFVDKDHGRFIGSDAEEAEEEEREARAIQAKIFSELSDADFGLDELQKTDATEKTTDSYAKEPGAKVDIDLTKLSDPERLEFLKKESPELMDLITDGRKTLDYLNVKLQPILSASEQQKINLSEKVSSYLRTKHQLTLGYLENLFFYLSLKAKRIPVETHSVTRRLLDYRRLLLKLAPLDQLYGPAIDTTLDLITKGKPLMLPASVQKAEKPKRGVSFSETVKLSDGTKKPPLNLTLAKPASQKTKNGMSDDADDSMDANGEASEEKEGKRQVSYQIMKNRGTTPYRKKEYRNPRVKHRMKYRKALINRKGQVKTYRPEVQKYGGEMNGIRAGVVKSVKFK